MNKKIVVLMLIAVVLIATWVWLGVFIDNQSGPPPMVQELSHDNVDSGDSASVSDEETITISSDIDKSDWKTYENTLYGFSFKHPKECSVSYEYDYEFWNKYGYGADINKVNEFYLTPTEETQTYTDGCPFYRLIFIFDKEGRLDPKDYLDYKLGKGTYRILEKLENGGYVFYADEREATVSWKRYSLDGELTGWTGQSVGDYNFLYPAEDYYILSFTYEPQAFQEVMQTLQVTTPELISNAPDNENLIPISDKEPIVITSDADTSGWQTYQNEELGFEFRYPEAWYLSKRPINPSEESYVLPFHIYVSPYKKLTDAPYVNLRLREVGEEESLQQIMTNWYREMQSRVPARYTTPIDSFSRVMIKNHEVLIPSKSLKITPFVNYAFRQGPHLLTIDIQSAGEITMETYHTILLTFKFIEN